MNPQINLTHSVKGRSYFFISNWRYFRFTSDQSELLLIYRLITCLATSKTSLLGGPWYLRSVKSSKSSKAKMDVWGAEEPFPTKNMWPSLQATSLKTAATFHQGSCCWTSVSPRHLHSPKICQPRLWVSPWDAMFLFGMASWQAQWEEIPFFGGTHYCQVPCWLHVGATTFAADFINTFLGHFEWTGPSTKDSCTSFFIQGTTTCSMGHLQSPPQKCVLGIRGKQTHKWTWSKPF